MYTRHILIDIPCITGNDYNPRVHQLFRLRKVKMDQRKLMDNANTITDMAKVSARK